MKTQEILKASIAPVVMVLLMFGLIFVLMLISELVPWGMGRGCWAQC